MLLGDSMNKKCQHETIGGVEIGHKWVFKDGKTCEHGFATDD